MVGSCGIYLSGSISVAGSFEHCNEPLGSIKGEELLDWLTDYYIVKDSAPCN
jgi:hypothetical protein